MGELGALAALAKAAPTLGPWLGIAGLISVLLYAFRPYREMAAKRENDEVTRLTAEVAVLRSEVRDTRAELDAQRVRFDARLEQERALHDAEMAIMRHRANNLEAIFNMLVELVEQSPDRAADTVIRIKALRAKQEAAEAAEKGMVMGARIIAAGDGRREKEDGA